MKLSIIIPVYNEAKTVAESIKRVKEAKIGGIEKEIVVINDGSTDATAEVLKKFKNDKMVRVVTHKINQGKSRALRTGFEEMSGEVVVIHDADLEYDPNDFRQMLEMMREKKARVVYGSRRLRKKNVQYSGLNFYLGGLFLTYMVNWLYGAKISDEPTCYKMFESKLLQSLKLKSERFEFCPEVTAKVLKQGIKIYEVPISYSPRKVIQGKKIKWKDFFEAVWTLLKYRFVD